MTITIGPVPLLLLAVFLSGCAGPPQARSGEILGYGTPGVESYAPSGDAVALSDLQARCRTVPDTAAPPRPQTLEAACDQLRRTLRNQPGSALARMP